MNAIFYFCKKLLSMTPHINLNLDKPDKDNECPIFLIISYPNTRFKYYTRCKIKREFWDVKEQIAKRNKKFPSHLEFNNILSQLVAFTKATFYRIKSESTKTPTRSQIRTELDKFCERNQVAKITLFEFLEKRYEHLINEGKTKGTAVRYNVLLNHFKEYAKTIGKNTFDFTDINHAFLKDFQRYCLTTKKHNPNNFHRIVGYIKTAMKEARKHKYHNDTEYEFFKVPKVPTHEIYLTLEELTTIYKTDLSSLSKGHEVTRDFFIIGCFTGGQRFSDWMRIDPTQIQTTSDGKQILTITTTKTKQTVSFPMTHPYVQEILKKYGTNFPKPLSNQKTNEYLKEIGKLAGIDTKITKIAYPSGVRTETSVEKYTEIATHTARRSFATNSYLLGTPLSQIRYATGHATEKQLIAYIKVNSLENAAMLADNSFYQK
jgi:Phage integrase SAM-like domain/Phage integrase family